ncbi:hypothetical protein [Actinomadura chibensis]|uniref:hypothetical protein n=1 Tax=Actinomadura chibensis TaxID=392828 RepID=UPI000AB5F6D8|nr:hypothetical protein [Actinomadura chibensis]
MTQVRWWGTGMVALALLVLCSALPLLDRALGSGGQRLAPGTVVSIGTERDGVRPVTVTVLRAGWVLSAADTSLTSNVKLLSDDVVFNLSVVVPLSSLNARKLWDGLGRIVAAGGRARLATGPAPVVTAHGMTGLTGRIVGRDRAGVAAVFATETLGATVTAAGPPPAFRAAAAEVEAMARTVTVAAP